jgi:hypothetical protein
MAAQRVDEKCDPAQGRPAAMSKGRRTGLGLCKKTQTNCRLETRGSKGQPKRKEEKKQPRWVLGEQHQVIKHVKVMVGGNYVGRRRARAWQDRAGDRAWRAEFARCLSWKCIRGCSFDECALLIGLLFIGRGTMRMKSSDTAGARKQMGRGERTVDPGPASGGWETLGPARRGLDGGRQKKSARSPLLDSGIVVHLFCLLKPLARGETDRVAGLPELWPLPAPGVRACSTVSALRRQTSALGLASSG